MQSEYDNLIKNISNLGYLLINANLGGNRTYEWHDFIMDLDRFNEDDFKKGVKLWSEYHERLHELDKKYL